jgi:hypothetical protein
MSRVVQQGGSGVPTFLYTWTIVSPEKPRVANEVRLPVVAGAVASFTWRALSNQSSLPDCNLHAAIQNGIQYEYIPVDIDFYIRRLCKSAKRIDVKCLPNTATTPR